MVYETRAVVREGARVGRRRPQTTKTRAKNAARTLLLCAAVVPALAEADRPEFQAHFEEHQVQLPLEQGDMLFFNPAAFHAAGANTTPDVARMANLLQISSGYCRSMETLRSQANELRALSHPPQAEGSGGPREYRRGSASPW